MKESEELGVIKQTWFGGNDRGSVGLTLAVTILHGQTQLFIPFNRCKSLLLKVTDVKDLVGEPVRVRNTDEIYSFIDLL